MVNLFINKDIITVPIFWYNKQVQFGFKLCDDELYGHGYINKIKEKSSVEKTFDKSTWEKLKGYSTTHIDGDHIFSTKDAEKKL